MEITKKAIKEGTLTTELDNGRNFGRRFKHYFEFSVKNDKINKIKFFGEGEVIEVIEYHNRLNDHPDVTLLHNYEGKKGFIGKVYDYIN
jgi:hypothetical protein